MSIHKNVKKSVQRQKYTRTGSTVYIASIVSVNPQLSHLLLQRLDQAPRVALKSALQNTHKNMYCFSAFYYTVILTYSEPLLVESLD